MTIKYEDIELINIPDIYETENTQHKEIKLKFFYPGTNWKWLVVEAKEEEDDILFFGYVCGLYNEWGYFTLSELNSIDAIPNITICIDKEYIGYKIDTNNNMIYKD